MTQTITVKTKAGDCEIPVIWQGASLAVHRPVKRGAPDNFRPGRGLFTITVVSLGLAAWPSLATNQKSAIALAKLWDDAFAGPAASGNAKGWPWAQRWADDVRRAERGRPLIGPRDLTLLEALDSAGTAADVERAVRAAMGYPGMDDSEAAEQWPADITRKQTGAGAIRKNANGVLEYWWLPKGGNYPDSEAMGLAGWYEVPAAGDVENWCLGSVAETPCGDSVEPDHPDAWPRLLGLI